MTTFEVSDYRIESGRVSKVSSFFFTFVSGLVFAGLIVGAGLVARRFPEIGTILALLPAAVMVAGLLFWLITGYLRFRIPDFKKRDRFSHRLISSSSSGGHFKP